MPEFPTILRVEVVGLIRQVYRNADKSFQVITGQYLPPLVMPICLWTSLPLPSLPLLSLPLTRCLVSVDDGTACIQCTAGLSTLNQAFIQGAVIIHSPFLLRTMFVDSHVGLNSDSELPPALQKMCRRLDQRELQTGEMVRVRGVLTADTYHGCNRKRIKVTEIG